MKEALAARPATADPAGYTIQRTPSNAEMRCYLDGEIPLPGLESLLKILRELSNSQEESHS